MSIILDTINDPNFRRVAAILRVPFWYSHARRDMPFWTLWRNVELAIHVGNKEDVLGALTDMLMQVANTTERLRYNVEDVRWIAETLDRRDWQMCMTTLLAFASSFDTLFSPMELAAVTDTAESTWRKYAATGHVIGAIKKGKQWLLPKSVLVTQGLLTAEQAQILAGQSGVTEPFDEDDTTQDGD